MPLPNIRSTDVESRFTNELRRSGLTFFSENSKGRAIAKIVGREIQNSTDFFLNNLDKAFLRYAQDEHLEMIALLFGLTREPATRASSYIWDQNQKFYVASGTFGDINGAADIVVPSGTLIETSSLSSIDAPVVYRTLGDITLGKDQSETFCPVEAVNEGSIGNVGAGTLTSHGFSGYTDYVNQSLLTRNNYAITNGQERQSDDDLRYIVSLAATAAEAGNQVALRLKLLQVPGLTDVKFINYYDGIGTTAAFVIGAGNESPPAMLVDAQEAITDRASNGIVALAYAPPRVGFAFSSLVTLTEPITVNEQAQLNAIMVDLVERYVLNLRIGDYLGLTDLLADLYRVDTRISSFGQDPTTSPFDELYIYRTSTVSGESVQEEWLDTSQIIPLEHEIIKAESSIPIPYLFTWQVAE